MGEGEGGSRPLIFVLYVSFKFCILYRTRPATFRRDSSDRTDVVTGCHSSLPRLIWFQVNEVPGTYTRTLDGNDSPT